MRVGDLAPDFTLPDDHGDDVTLSLTVTRGPVVLFFYPVAMSRGCAKELRHFRDLASEFAALGAQLIGVSMDTVERQAQFARANALDFPLLADGKGKVAALYGVKRGLDLLRVKRATFVIGTDRVVREVITSELAMDVHADRALAALSPPS
jgi:peroxiredoxin Q/BCP